MSEEESFLERWARRKREAAKTESPSDANCVADDPQATGDANDGAGRSAKLDPPSVGGSASAPPPFDLTKLPSLDSITAETDIRTFMLPGVPAEVSRAALRRAWSVDPAIREFVGLADYDWDFNTEGAITGFGPLEMTEELRRRVTDMVGRSLGPDRPDQSQTSVPEDQTTANAGENLGTPARPVLKSSQTGAEMSKIKTAPDQAPSRNCEEFSSSEQVYVASHHSPAVSGQEPAVVPRRHGRALPK